MKKAFYQAVTETRQEMTANELKLDFELRGELMPAHGAPGDLTDTATASATATSSATSTSPETPTVTQTPQGGTG